jgi:hypothetical protein
MRTSDRLLTRLAGRLAQQVSALELRNAQLCDELSERGLEVNCATKERETDPFDFVISLEEHFVEEGHTDGLARGRAEGLCIGRDLG